MPYFKINNTDLSSYVAELNVKNSNKYISQTNAEGDAIVDFLTNKRTIEVEIIPLVEADFRIVLNAIVFNPTISYRDPLTGNLITANCVIDDNEFKYYTIQTNKVMYKKMTLKFKEL